MIIQGRVLSISHAPALQKRVKELESLVTGLKWQVDFLTHENETLLDQVNHYKHLILLEGAQRKRLSKQRYKKVRTRPGWIPPEQRTPEQPA